MTDKLKITQLILLIPFPLNKNKKKKKKQDKQKHVTGVTGGIKRAHVKLWLAGKKIL